MIYTDIYILHLIYKDIKKNWDFLTPIVVRGGGGKIGHATQNLFKSDSVRIIITLL